MKDSRMYVPCQFIICSLLIMLISSKDSYGLFSGSSSPGVVTPSFVVISEGSTLALNCTLTKYSSTSLRSEALYFTSFYVVTGIQTYVNNTYYHIRSDTTMEMMIPNVRRGDGTTFKCFMNDSGITGKSSDTQIGTASADIGEPPYPIENIRVVSNNFVNMTVDWCPEVIQDDPVSSTLFWQINGKSGNCTAWTDDVGKCSCVFCGYQDLGICLGKPQSFHSWQTYLINITSSNQYGSTSAYTEVYTSPKIVKPGRVTNLTVELIASRQMIISWNPPEWNVIDLKYRICTSSKWGENEIEVGNNTSWVLTELTPHSNYMIVVRCKPVEDGYWSDNSSVSGFTLEDAPEVAPNVPIGFFRLSVCSDKCNVTVFWQLIDEKLQNGVILGYQLSVKSKHCSPYKVFSVSGSDRTSTVISFANDVDSSVELVARTSVGYSPPRYIYFPAHFDSLPNALSQDLYAEYTMDKTGVFFKWNYSEDVDNYTLMYCRGIQNDPNSCQEGEPREDYPRYVVLSKHQTNYTLNITNPNHVYSLSANYRNGSNGLTAQWLCIYEYSGLPEKPKMRSPVQMSDTSIKISWDSLQCSSVNRFRVLHYVLSYAPNGIDAGENLTLPGGATEYIVTGLVPETVYNLTLYAVSRSGPGPNTTEEIQTTVPKPVNIVRTVVLSVVIPLVVIIFTICFVICVIKCRRWFTGDGINIKPPDKHERVSSNLPNDSSDVCEPYTTVMINSDSPNGIFYSSSSSSTSSNRPILQTNHSESESSGASTETSVICDSIESIQAYTAVRSDEVSYETDNPNCSQAMSIANCQLAFQDASLDPPQSSSHDLKPDSCDSGGYSQGKLRDSKFDSSVLCNSTSHKLHSSSSVDSSESFDDYTKTEMREDIPYDLSGPPAMPQML